MPKIDLIGKRFGRLVVLAEDGKTKKGEVMWMCKCDCGATRTVRGSSLRSGVTQSCGCRHREIVTERATAHPPVPIVTHHRSRTRLYSVWQGMKQRCNNPNDTNYKNYGGRGVSICDEWTRSFEAFSEWAAANGYDERAPRGECTIDRIDVNGNYEPSNCRWASAAEQNCNKRTTRRAQ